MSVKLFTDSRPEYELWRICLLAVLYWLTSGSASRGELTFESTEIRVDAKPMDTALDGRFSFKNTGTKTITIQSIKSDCSCTTPKLDKPTYAPGEAGEIAVHFDIGGRQGLQKKTILLTTDQSDKLQVLTMVTDLPQVITLPKTGLLWDSNESAEAKTLVVQTSEQPPVQEVIARSQNRFLKLEVERTSATEFQLKVTPLANQRNISASVQVEAVLADNRRKSATVFVRVR